MYQFIEKNELFMVQCAIMDLKFLKFLHVVMFYNQFVTVLENFSINKAKMLKLFQFWWIFDEFLHKNARLKLNCAILSPFASKLKFEIWLLPYVEHLCKISATLDNIFGAQGLFREVLWVIFCPKWDKMGPNLPLWIRNFQILLHKPVL